MEDGIFTKRVNLPVVIENVLDDTHKSSGDVLMTVKTLIRTYDDVRDAYKKVYRNWKIEEKKRELSDERVERDMKRKDDEIDVVEIKNEIL